MTEHVPVIIERQAVEAAYDAGYDHFEDAPKEADEESIGYYKEGAEWSNNMLPHLRALAGFEDSMGVGTYTGGRDVVVVPTYRDGDVPALGTEMDSAEVLDTILEAFNEGARDAINGETREYPHDVRI